VRDAVVEGVARRFGLTIRDQRLAISDWLSDQRSAISNCW